jgi:hypothetical protein
MLTSVVKLLGCEGFALLDSHSGLSPSIVNLDLQHWVSRKQCSCCLLGSTLFRKLSFKVAIDHHRVSISGRYVGSLNIFGLLFFDAESWFFHMRFCEREIPGLMPMRIASVTMKGAPAEPCCSLRDEDRAKRD